VSARSGAVRAAALETSGAVDSAIRASNWLLLDVLATRDIRSELVEGEKEYMAAKDAVDGLAGLLRN
jgi:hypothetical protein